MINIAARFEQEGLSYKINKEDVLRKFNVGDFFDGRDVGDRVLDFGPGYVDDMLFNLREFALPTSVIRKVCARLGGFELQVVSPLPAMPGMPGASRKSPSLFTKKFGNPPRA